MTDTFTFIDGTTVPRIGFGAMRLTGQPGNFGPYRDPDAGIALIRRAHDLGVRLFDGALAYGPHHADRLLGEALSGREALIASKAGVEKAGPTGADITRDARPETLRRHVEETLRDLGAERISLYYLHWPGRDVPLAESVGALQRAREEGKIGMVGVSNVDLSQLEEALGTGPIGAVQNRWDAESPGDRAVLEQTGRKGIAFVPYGPLGANPMKPGAPLAEGGTGAALRALLDLAPNVLPIPGTTSPEHLEENWAALAR